MTSFDLSNWGRGELNDEESNRTPTTIPACVALLTGFLLLYDRINKRVAEKRSGSGKWEVGSEG